MTAATQPLLAEVDAATQAKIRQVLAKAGLSEDDPVAVIAVLLGHVQKIGGELPSAIHKAGDRLIERVEKATVSLVWSRWQLRLVFSTILLVGLLGLGAGWLWRDATLARNEPLAHWLLTSDAGQRWLALARQNDLEQVLAVCRKTMHRQEGRTSCWLPLWIEAGLQ